MRSEVSQELIGTPGQRFAVAADFSVAAAVPSFKLSDFVGISDLIEQRYFRPKVDYA